LWLAIPWIGARNRSMRWRLRWYRTTMCRLMLRLPHVRVFPEMSSFSGFVFVFPKWSRRVGSRMLCMWTGTYVSVANKGALDLRAQVESEKHTSFFFRPKSGKLFCRWYVLPLWSINGRCPIFLWWMYGNPSLCTRTWWVSWSIRKSALSFIIQSPALPWAMLAACLPECTSSLPSR
jgi:hypothetical protein